MTDKLFTNHVGGGMGTGARGTFTMLFGNEILGMMVDMRWGLLLMALLILADYRYGIGESQKRYAAAKAAGNDILMEHFKVHGSRAWRRTANKTIDYLILLTVCGSIGMAILEPVGISHVWGSWLGALIVFRCEVFSIFGHFFFLRGVVIEKRTLRGFLKALVVAFAKKKDEDVGSAIEEAINKTEKEDGKGKDTDAGTEEL